MAQPQRDLTRTLLGVLSLGALIAASVWILLPFLVPAIWATMFVVATWPILLWMQARLWRRRWLAVTAMTFVLLLAFVLPLGWMIGTVALNADEVVGGVKALASFRMPEPPRWVADLPFVGRTAVRVWRQAAASGVDGMLARLEPSVGGATQWLVASAGSLGYLSLQFLLTLVLATLMYARGERAAAAVRLFGRRTAGPRGENSVKVAGQAVRGVVLGVGVTALVQSVLGGIGLAIAGVAFAGLLTVLMFVLCLAQIGPSLVLIPAVVWVYWHGEVGWGTFLLVWSVIVSTSDNFMRPLLIRRSADMPLLLVFAGVIGGLFAFGLVGIFVGPVVLAVAYKLLEAWLYDEERPAIEAPP